MTTDAALDASVRRVLASIMSAGAPYVTFPLVDPTTGRFPEPTMQALAESPEVSGIITGAVGDIAGSLADSAEASAQAAEDAKAAAGTAAFNAGASAAAAQSSEDDARTARTAAETARGDAQTARDAAQSARTGAEAARDLALAGQFAGSALGTADLNTITTPGIYHQVLLSNVTYANHYPVESLRIALQVMATATSYAVQVLYPLTNSDTLRGQFTRRWNGSSWTAWAFTPTQRVDQTAGRAIYTGDDLNNREQLIYGDTGWRDMPLENGWTGTIRVRRIGSVVEVVGANLVFGTGINVIVLPLGVRSSFGIPIVGRPPTATAVPPVGSINSGVIAFPSGATFHGYSFQVTYTTTDTWPTTLPGTAVGSIPA